MHATCPVHLIVSYLITQIAYSQEYNFEAPHDAVFSIPPLLPIFYVQIFSLAPCSQTPSIYVHPVTKIVYLQS
jgi:hypothetical protein